MKKIKLLLTMAVITFSVMLCFSMSAFALTEGDWEFKLLNNEVTITKYIGDGGAVVVPETIAGLPVTNIVGENGSGEGIFKDCEVTSLEIKAKIKEFSRALVWKQKNLEKVILPEGLEVIGDMAFYQCERLKEVNIPSTVKRIDSDAFKYCSSLNTVKLPVGIESVGGGAFAGTNVTEMDLSNVKSAINTRFGDMEMFADCKNLKRVTLSPMIERVADKMFIGCTSLEEVVIPNGVKIIGERAFGGCTSLENIILPTTLTKIERSAFNSAGLKEVIIPYGTKLISTSAFARCENLEALYIPDSVDTMYQTPIYECPNAIIYCSDGSYAAQFCQKEGVSYLTDNSVNSGIHVYYNGKRISFHSYAQNPEILEGRTLVPLRSIFEAMGADVEWDGATSTAIAKRGNVEVKITIGANEIHKNGKAIPVDVPAQLMNSRTMVPARVIAEAFGADVQWNGNGRTVLISESR